MAVPSTGSAIAAIGGSSLLGVGGSAIYGGLIGGMASASWKGAATGALAGGGITAVGYGTFLILGRAYALGTILAALGVGGVTWSIMRWSKARRRR